MPRSAGLKPTEVAPSEEVLILVDVINPFHFPRAESLVKPAHRAATHIVKLKSRLKRKGTAAIYANDNYGTWHSEFRQILAACSELPAERGEIARILSPRPEDLVILKPQYSAFHSTPLLHLLRRMDAKKLIIVGFAADMCVLLTATDAHMAGFEVWVPGDCTAALSPQRRAHALYQLKQTFGCSTRHAQSASRA